MPRPQWLTGPDGPGFWWLSVSAIGLTLARVEEAPDPDRGLIYEALGVHGWHRVDAPCARWQRLYEPADAPHGNQEAQR